MPLLIVLFAEEGTCCGGHFGRGGVVAGAGGGCCDGPLGVLACGWSAGAQGSSSAVCIRGVVTLFAGEGGGNMSLLAEAVLCCWYMGYVLLGASLLEVPWRGQLIVLVLPVLMFLMQFIAYSFVVFKKAAASVLPPWSGCAVSCRNLQFLLTSSMRGCPSLQPKAQKGHAMRDTAGDGTYAVIAAVCMF